MKHAPTPPPDQAALLYYDDVAIIDPPEMPDASESALLDALEAFLVRVCTIDQVQRAA